MKRVAMFAQFAHRNGGALWAAVEPRDEITALAAKVERACSAAGLEPEREAFVGFVHPAVITVACVLILSQGLQNTGAVD